jgi:hypothetical protein
MLELSSISLLGLEKNGEIFYKPYKVATSHPFHAKSSGFWGFFFFCSYCLIATVLNWVTKKINRAQSGSSLRSRLSGRNMRSTSPSTWLRNSNVSRLPC